MNIVICIDQTVSSSQAIESVAGSGILEGQTVFLLHVCHESGESERALLNGAADQIGRFCQNVKIKKIIAQGSKIDTILDQCSILNADLLVVGSNERSSIERAILGSVSQALVAKAKCPVLIARGGPHVGTGKVLFPVDDSLGSSAAINWLYQKPWIQDKQVIMLSMISNISRSFHSDSVAKAAEALSQHDCAESIRLKLLDEWAMLFARLTSRANQIPFTVNDGEPISCIKKAASHWGAEFVVMGANNKLRFERLMLGSVSQAVACELECSILIVHAHDGGYFEAIRQGKHKESGLEAVLAEKPHPARTHSPITGTDTNGFMVW